MEKPVDDPLTPENVALYQARFDLAYACALVEIEAILWKRVSLTLRMTIAAAAVLPTVIPELPMGLVYLSAIALIVDMALSPADRAARAMVEVVLYDRIRKKVVRLKAEEIDLELEQAAMPGNVSPSRTARELAYNRALESVGREPEHGYQMNWRLRLLSCLV